MPDEIGDFQIAGLSWGERAQIGELNAVLAPKGSERTNRFLHSMNQIAAYIAAALTPRRGVVVDFGCGTGRFVRYFGSKGYRIVGTEITPEMLYQARKFGVPSRTLLLRTDGVVIPARASSIDLIWCCGVLRFSLLVPNPVYTDIAKEMFRVLKPGGLVVNLEIYVDNPPQVFVRDFEATGFRTRYTGVLHRWSGKLEEWLYARIPNRFLSLAGKFCAAVRLLTDNPRRGAPGLRDYLFIFSKPRPDRSKPRPDRTRR